MKKQYIIIVVIVVVLWSGFMIYRHQKKKQDNNAYTQKAYNQVTEVAKKSPRAGLAQVGMALNKYYEKNNAYPSALNELVPEYLANKSLIEEIDWYYEPRGDDFFLSKTLILGNKRIVASVDKALRPQAETGVMVAAPTVLPKAMEIKRPEELIEVGPQGAEPPAKSRLALAREQFLKTLRQRRMDVTSVSRPERDEARIISIVQPEIISISEAEKGSGVEFELSRNYLVWKERNGVLGFSNTQYPVVDRLSICAIGMWYNIKVPLPQAQGPMDAETQIGTRRKGPDMIAATLNRRHLVWKDEMGVLGFGNVQYPERAPVSVFQTEDWISIERPHLSTETAVKEDHGVQDGKSRETIASEFGTRYLVWKNKNGNLGFGNVQYPERGSVSVFQTDDWVSMAHPSTGTDAVENYSFQKGKSREAIVSELSTRYLVWKDKNGTLGFGNLLYPEVSDTSHIHINGSWEPVAN